MKNLYLLLAIVGGVVPFIFFFQHFATEGVFLYPFVEAAFGNSVASGIGTELLMTSFVFWLAMFHQQKAGKGPSPVPFIVLNLLVGLSCAFPAYLYARQVKRENA